MAEQIGEITILHGSATAQGSDGVRELAAGSPIYSDDIISTGAKSALEIEFSDGALLSQGAHSTVQLDSYVFDPDSDAGEMTMQMIEGTFRSVTGKIVDMNPEGFRIETPNSTIGIRGTTTGHEIDPDGTETHAVIDFVDKPVVFTSRVDGSVQIIARDGFKVMSTPQGMSGVMQATASDLSTFEQLSTRSMERSAPQDGQDEQENPDNGDAPRDEGQENGQQGDDPQEASGEETGGEIQDEIIAVHGGEMPVVPASGLPQGATGIGLVVPEPMVDLTIQEITPVQRVTNDQPETVDEDNTADSVNQLWGTAGNDSIVGTAGKDIIHSSGGQDTLDGDNGFDSVSYADHDGKVYINFASQTVTKYDAYGSSVGTDEIHDFEGFYGSSGDDTFKFHTTAPASETQLFGGDGTDTILVYGNTDLSTLQSVDSVEKLEFASYGASATFAAENLASVLPQEIVGYTSGCNEKVIINTSTSADGTYDLSGYTLTSWETSDMFVFNGNSGSDTVYGTSGSDSIVGLAGNDELNGNSGADTLSGGDGNDILFGGLGSDSLTGGNGSDLFKYISTSDGSDTITDFDHTDDGFVFESSSFGGYTGTLDSGHFFSSAGSVTGTDACFYVDSDTLYYDADGTGGTAAVAIADCGADAATIDHTDITFS